MRFEKPLALPFRREVLMSWQLALGVFLVVLALGLARRYFPEN
jgi:hypothetical protein